MLAVTSQTVSSYVCLIEFELQMRRRPGRFRMFVWIQLAGSPSQFNLSVTRTRRRESQQPLQRAFIAKIFFFFAGRVRNASGSRDHLPPPSPSSAAASASSSGYRSVFTSGAGSKVPGAAALLRADATGGGGSTSAATETGTLSACMTLHYNLLSLPSICRAVEWRAGPIYSLFTVARPTFYCFFIARRARRFSLTLTRSPALSHGRNLSPRSREIGTLFGGWRICISVP